MPSEYKALNRLRNELEKNGNLEEIRRGSFSALEKKKKKKKKNDMKPTATKAAEDAKKKAKRNKKQNVS
jgi:hypothetical protein